VPCISLHQKTAPLRRLLCVLLWSLRLLAWPFHCAGFLHQNRLPLWVHWRSWPPWWLFEHRYPVLRFQSLFQVCRSVHGLYSLSSDLVVLI
jgi:hypothetical protein